LKIQFIGIGFLEKHSLRIKKNKRPCGWDFARLIYGFVVT
jgi:hypothetical protein